MKSLEKSLPMHSVGIRIAGALVALGLMFALAAGAAAQSGPLVFIGNGAVPYVVTEGAATSVTIPVELDEASSTQVTVDWHTQSAWFERTASDSGGQVDYAAAAGTVVFAPGQRFKTITVSIFNDFIAEEDESFVVALDNAVGAQLGIPEDFWTHGAVVTIHDNELGAFIGEAGYTLYADEGDSGTTRFEIPVRLNFAGTAPVSVGWATGSNPFAQNAASPDEDYQAASGTVTFAPGETAKTIDVGIIGDTIYEPGESFRVSITGVVGALQGVPWDGSLFGATVEIRDDDAASSEIEITPTGSQTFGSSAPTFEHSESPPAGVSVTGTLTCTGLSGGAAISSNLAAGGYTIDGSTCSGLSLSGADASAYTLSYIDGPFTVTAPTEIAVTTTGSQSFGSSAPVFDHSENLPSGISITGTLTCSAVSGGTAISPALPVGSYTIDGSTCSGLALSGTGSAGLAIVYTGGAFTVAATGCTVSWTGGGGDGLWATAANWSTGGVPGPSDEVCIDATPAADVTSTADVSIAKLQLANSLTIAGGTFSISGAADGIAVDGAGTLTVAGALEWSGGAQQGSGTTKIVSAGSLRISGSNAKSLGESRQLRIDNGGLASWTGGAFGLSDGARIDNGGHFDARTDGLISGAVTTAVTNNGVFMKSGSAGNTTIGVPFTNNGMVHVAAGSVDLTSSFTNYDAATRTLTGGSYVVEGPTGRLSLPSDIVTNAASISLVGAGSAIVSENSADALAHFATNAPQGGLTIRDGRNLTTSGVLTNVGSIAIGANSTLTVNGNYIQTEGVTLLETPTSALVVFSPNFASFSGGTLGGTGTVNGLLVNGSNLYPGLSPGVLHIAGDYAQESGASLTIEIEGSTAGTEYDRLDVSGAAALDGTLNVVTGAGFNPTVGSAFRFLTYASRTGSFRAVTGTALPSGLVYRVVYHATYAELVVAAPRVAIVQQPINADGSSVFNAARGVIPIKFTLAVDGSPTCILPPATIAVSRVTGSATGAVNESVYGMAADSGASFRIDNCQYIYNLNSRPLAAGRYRVEILVDGAAAGSASFELR